MMMLTSVIMVFINDGSGGHDGVHDSRGGDQDDHECGGGSGPQ